MGKVKAWAMELEEKAKGKVTEDQVFDWLGGDSAKVHEMIEIITWIANGEYTPEVLKSDIESYGNWDEEE